MIKKPDWSKAPGWAKSTAMDSDGQWCWYNEEHPCAGYDKWLTDDAWEYVIDFEEFESDKWRNTLEKRP